MAITKISPDVVDFDAGITISTADNTDTLTLTSTDADANSGPNLNLYRNSGSPADNDVLGYLKFTGVNDNSEIINYARIRTDLTDASDGTEDGSFYIFAMNAGTERTRVSVVPSETVFNDESQDLDFRVESDGNANMLFVDGGNDRVGIGTASPAYETQIYSADDTVLSVVSGDSNSASLYLGDAVATRGRLTYDNSNDSLAIYTDNNERVRIDSSGKVGIGDTSPYAKLHVEDTGWSSGSPYGTVAYIQGGAVSDANWGHLLLSQSGTTTDTGGRLAFGANGENPIAGIRAKYKGATYGDLAFSTRPSGGTNTERMVIDSAGAAYFMTTSDMGGDINVNHTSGIAIGGADDQGYYRRLYLDYSSSATLKFWNGSNEGTLSSSGAWTDASDISLKKDIVDIEYGLEVVKKLKPRKYKMKSDDSDQIGFVAQEVETEVPEVVSTGENPNGEEQKSLSYGHLVAVLTKAIQEQQTLIETLEAKVKALEEA